MAGRGREEWGETGRRGGGRAPSPGSHRDLRPPPAALGVAGKGERRRRPSPLGPVPFLPFRGRGGAPRLRLPTPARPAALEAAAGPPGAAPGLGAASRSLGAPLPGGLELPPPPARGCRPAAGAGAQLPGRRGGSRSPGERSGAALPLLSGRAVWGVCVCWGGGRGSRTARAPVSNGGAGGSPRGPGQPCGGAGAKLASSRAAGCPPRRCLRGGAAPGTGPAPCRPPEQRVRRRLTGARGRHAFPGRGWPRCLPQRPRQRRLRTLLAGAAGLGLPPPRSSLPRRLAGSWETAVNLEKGTRVRNWLLRSVPLCLVRRLGELLEGCAAKGRRGGGHWPACHALRQRSRFLRS